MANGRPPPLQLSSASGFGRPGGRAPAQASALQTAHLAELFRGRSAHGAIDPVAGSCGSWRSRAALATPRTAVPVRGRLTDPRRQGAMPRLGTSSSRAPRRISRKARSGQLDCMASPGCRRGYAAPAAAVPGPDRSQRAASAVAAPAPRVRAPAGPLSIQLGRVASSRRDAAQLATSSGVTLRARSQTASAVSRARLASAWGMPLARCSAIGKKGLGWGRGGH